MSDYDLFECDKLFSGAEEGVYGFESSLSQNLADHPLHITSAQEFNCASDGSGTTDSDGECSLQPANLVKKCSSKSPTSHSSGKTKTRLTSPEEVDDMKEDFEKVLNGVFSEESNSLPLVSAMKGSREKSGASPRKLNVKWDPDVYDPPPTIVSHTVVRGKKQQQKSRKERKNWKDKKKGGGNSSRGANGKDKKQYRKTAGSPSKCQKSPDAHDRVANDFHDYDNDGFEVHSSDSYCGSSFLKKTPNNVHFSLAEAS